MPVVGYASGGTDFSDKMIVLKEAVIGADGAEVSPMNAIKWGSWLNTIISLIMVGWVLFMIAKSKIRFMGAAPAPGPTPDQELLAEIRDALKK